MLSCRTSALSLNCYFVFTLQREFASLPSHDDILKEATKLNREATNLKTMAGGVVGDLASELEKAENLQADAQEVNDHTEVTCHRRRDRLV